MIKVKETESEIPICPHCESKINEILAKKTESTFGVRFLYFCPKCKKTLGITHRKGFWMG